MRKAEYCARGPRTIIAERRALIASTDEGVSRCEVRGGMKVILTRKLICFLKYPRGGVR